jgi:hypothetical protein
MKRFILLLMPVVPIVFVFLSMKFNILTSSLVRILSAKAHSNICSSSTKFNPLSSADAKLHRVANFCASVTRSIFKDSNFEVSSSSDLMYFGWEIIDT